MVEVRPHTRSVAMPIWVTATNPVKTVKTHSIMTAMFRAIPPNTPWLLGVQTRSGSITTAAFILVSFVSRIGFFIMLTDIQACLLFFFTYTETSNCSDYSQDN